MTIYSLDLLLFLFGTSLLFHVQFSREMFDRSKLLNGLMRACEKRPVSMDILEKITNEIESELLNSLEREVTSLKIGEMAMTRLKQVDEIAYVRFASVYRQFADVNSFMEEITRLLHDHDNK